MFPRLRLPRRTLPIVAVLFATAFSLAAAESVKRAFDLPAGDAASTLRQFTAQASEQVAFPAEAVRGITTKAIKGEFTPREALDRMTSGTPLLAMQDEKSGALTVRRVASVAQAEKNGVSRPSSDRAATENSAAPRITPERREVPTGEELIKLSPFVVSEGEDQGYAARDTLAGTRIRTELKDVGSSISVITKQFLEDTNSNAIESLLVYVPNAEVSAEGGNFLGKGDAGILTTPPSTATRGLSYS